MTNRLTFAPLLAAAWAICAAPAFGQGWIMVDTEGMGGAGAQVCAEPGSDGGMAPCLRFTCENETPLHYEIMLFDADSVGLPDEVPVELRVDGRAAGLLLFQPTTADGSMAVLSAPYDPRLHTRLIAQLRQGTGAEMVLQAGAEAARVVPFSLRGSSKALGAVIETCPVPEVPLDDPAAVVLDEVVRACGQLGGSVAMEPGFERREDLDGDGRADVVIDFAAAVCSEMASLYCGSGGCTVGFFLARDDGYLRIFDGVIRDYYAKPDGLLALDLHGTACGLYGFEACRKVFRISDDSFALVEEISGPDAEAVQAADRAARAEAPAEAEPPADTTAPDTTPQPEPEPLPVADPEPTSPEPDATPADLTPDPQATAPATLEWIGEGGSIVVPAEGESLPTDLVPEAETPPAGDGG